jgi:25S rRNA (uracil2634-N3)-methyltransferase
LLSDNLIFYIDVSCQCCPVVADELLAPCLGSFVLGLLLNQVTSFSGFNISFAYRCCCSSSRDAAPGSLDPQVHFSSAAIISRAQLSFTPIEVAPPTSIPLPTSFHLAQTLLPYPTNSSLGDFSFALSLLQNHHCISLLATTYDDEETCYRKYPQARTNIQKLLSYTPTATPPSQPEGAGSRQNDTSERTPTSDVGEDEYEDEDPDDGNSKGKRRPHILFKVDARHLIWGGALPSPPHFTSTNSSAPSISGTKLIRNPPFVHKSRSRPSGGPWDVIIFNYPHVGGLSTDVNRQVRSNQALLVDFFKSCIPLLSKPSRPPAHTHHSNNNHNGHDKSGWASDDPDGGKQGGRILVSLFTGEPYTLWNIRDLARHCGLKVLTSLKFPWIAFPGYRHARTVGNIESKKDGKDGGRRGWKGEEREGRWFVFCVDDGNGGDGRRRDKGMGDGSEEDD